MGPRTSKIEARAGTPSGLGTKIDQISILGALVAGLSWWRLGGVLEAFWDRLERLLGPNLVPKTGANMV